MIVIWGEVEEPSYPVIGEDDWETCLELCYEEESCLIASQITFGCVTYGYGKFKSLVFQSSGTYKIGVKKTLTTCPKTIFTQEVVTETYSSRLVAYNYTISLSSPNQWKFDFNSYFQCPNDSFVSIRGPNRVCISVRVFQSPDFCLNQTYGAELCKKDGAIGLTGPYSLDEADVIAGYMNEKVIEEPANFEYDHNNFWTDGRRATPDAFNVTDETLNGTTGYRWIVTPTEASDKLSCSFIVDRKIKPFGIYVYCSYCYQTKRTYDDSFCQRGAVCKTQPIINS